MSEQHSIIVREEREVKKLFIRVC